MPFSLGQSLATDLYQLTMAAGYFHAGKQHHEATCELFVRRLPACRRYLVALGLDWVSDHLAQLRFSESDIAFLRNVPSLAEAMTPAFCAYLREFRFRGDVWSMPEGSIAFENEPMLRVRAPLIEAQLIETFALSVVNHASMIGSKAARIVRAAQGRKVVEFGTRRTHADAAVDAARCAYAAGFAATSNVLAASRHGIPVTGTAAHMWIMSFPSEAEAFESYLRIFPESSVLLIDTYDTLRGAELAARIGAGKMLGVRLDSGDLGALAKEVRSILDREGAAGAKIVVSGDLNEHAIARLLAEGAPIDTFGVGTELVCSADAPALGGVYKLVELDDGTGRRPTAKFSPGKATYAGAHQVFRITGEGGRFERDVVALEDEAPPTLAGGQRATALLEPAWLAGQRVRESASLAQVRERVGLGLEALPPALLQLSDRGPEEASPVRPSSHLIEITEAVRVARQGGEAS